LAAYKIIDKGAQVKPFEYEIQAVPTLILKILKLLFFTVWLYTSLFTTATD